MHRRRAARVVPEEANLLFVPPKGNAPDLLCAGPETICMVNEFRMNLSGRFSRKSFSEEVLLMLRRKFIRVETDPRMQGPFAWPFKVLYDLFHNPPFVADPEFTPFDLGVLRSKSPQPSADIPRPTVFYIDSTRLIFWFWLVELVVAPILGLIVLESVVR